jgi:hypothetical protein
MIEKAKGLNKNNQEVFLAFLHFLHMTEHLGRPRQKEWVYKNIQAHWVRSKPVAYWVR